MFQNIPGYQFDPLRCHVGLLAVDIPDTLVINIRFGVHGLNIVHSERENILIIDSVHNGIGVELIAESLGSSKELCSAGCPGIGRKDRRAGKTKQVILLEVLDDSGMHIAELTAVALIEDDDHMLFIDRMGCFLFDEGGQLLDGSNDNISVVILQLLFQDSGGGVAVGCAFFKAIVLFHGLVV